MSRNVLCNTAVTLKFILGHRETGVKMQSSMGVYHELCESSQFLTALFHSCIPRHLTITSP